jgi:hypothetical protein
MDVIGACLLQKFGHVGSRDGIAIEAGFEALEPDISVRLQT